LYVLLTQVINKYLKQSHCSGQWKVSQKSDPWLKQQRIVSVLFNDVLFIITIIISQISETGH